MKQSEASFIHLVKFMKREKFDNLESHSFLRSLLNLCKFYVSKFRLIRHKKLENTVQRD